MPLWGLNFSYTTVSQPGSKTFNTLWLCFKHRCIPTAFLNLYGGKLTQLTRRGPSRKKQDLASG